MNISLLLSAFALQIGAFFYFYHQNEKRRARIELELEMTQENALSTRHKLESREEELLFKEKEISALLQENRGLQVWLEEEKKTRAELMKLEEEMKAVFKAVSSDALRSTQSSFFELAKETFDKYQTGMNLSLAQKELAIDTLVKPLKESLDKVDGKIQELEKSRLSAYVQITEQLKTLQTTQLQLETQTGNLVKALRMPHI